MYQEYLAYAALLSLGNPVYKCRKNTQEGTNTQCITRDLMWKMEKLGTYKSKH